MAHRRRSGADDRASRSRATPPASRSTPTEAAHEPTLYRSRTDTILGGVAAGLANYLNADPALVRIAWAVLTPLTGGIAFLAYIVAWVVVPEEPVGVASRASRGASVASADGSEEARETALRTGPGGDRHRRHRRDGVHGGRAALVVGIGLVLLGIWFLSRVHPADQLGPALAARPRRHRRAHPGDVGAHAA